MKKSTVIIVWGAITGLADCIFYQFLNMGDNMNSGLRYISWIIVFAGLLIGTLQYRKANEGYITYGGAYKAGILMTLVISVISTIGFAVFLQMHPEFPQKLIDMQKIAMINKGTLTSDQIDNAMQMASKFMTSSSLIIFGFLGGIVTGAIMSLLSSGIAMKKKPFTEGENTTQA